MIADFAAYTALLTDIKTRIRRAQTRAMLSANQQMIELYWDVGRRIHARQHAEGWGAAVIPRLAADLKIELPETKGFSERNLKRMIRFYREYPELDGSLNRANSHGREKVPQPVAQISDAAEIQGDLAMCCVQLPWSHNFLLIEQVKHRPTRLWYMQQAIRHGWSRDVLGLMIKSRSHERQGAATTNFECRLPPPQSDLAQQVLKDPYVFDFLTVEAP